MHKEWYRIFNLSNVITKHSILKPNLSLSWDWDASVNPKSSKEENLGQRVKQEASQPDDQITEAIETKWQRGQHWVK